MIERLSLRRLCSRCGRVATEEKFCIVCGGDLYQRQDDGEVTVKRRLELFRKETAPLLDYYHDHGQLVEIDGSGNPDEIFNRIKKSLRILQKGK